MNCTGDCNQGRDCMCWTPITSEGGQQVDTEEEHLTTISKVILYAILFFVIGGMFATVLWQVANLPGVL